MVDVIQAIENRKCIRGYKSTPVPRPILEELVREACRAPSWANIQPWELVLVGGKVMEDLKDALVEKARAQVTPNPDIPWPELPEVSLDRRRRNMALLLESMGIARSDIERRTQWTLEMYRFFGAPSAVYFCMDRRLSVWSLLDIGMALQTLMLAANGLGLGTAPLAAVIRYPDEVRRILKIPDSKLIVIGAAIGYPDYDVAANKFRSEREPIQNLATWHGL